MASVEIPARMKAAAFDEFGPPEVVHIELVPVPKLDAHDVLVEIATAGVGVWDPELVDGSFKVGKVRFPQVLALAARASNMLVHCHHVGDGTRRGAKGANAKGPEDPSAPPLGDCSSKRQQKASPRTIVIALLANVVIGIAKSNT